MKIDLKNPGTQKAALTLVLCLMMLGAFFFTHFVGFSFPNQREKLSALKAEYEKKSTELARARATVSDLPRFEAEYVHLHERWSAAAELLPTDHELPGLLRKITLAAQQTGVEFLLFRPSDAKSEEHYTELPIQLSVYGGYHQIGSFMAELANQRRIITVTNLQLKSNSKADDAATTAAEFTASAYSMNSAPEPSVAPASPKEGRSHARKSS